MHVSKLQVSPLVMLETNGKQICQVTLQVHFGWFNQNEKLYH